MEKRYRGTIIDGRSHAASEIKEISRTTEMREEECRRCLCRGYLVGGQIRGHIRVRRGERQKSLGIDLEYMGIPY